jgi:ferritin-like metal-binding protein YciE
MSESETRSLFVTGLRNAHAMENEALFGEDHSTLKDIGGSIMGTMAAMGHTVAPDEILKNSFANFAFENFEIAAYKSLLTIAELGGFPYAISGLEANLAEEQAMANWLDANLRAVTVKFASLREAGETAKI